MKTSKEKKINIKNKKFLNKFTMSKVGLVFYKIFRTIFLIGISYIFLFPILYMISSAFAPISQVNDPSVAWIPKKLTLENIKKAAEAMNYSQSIKNTLKINMVSMVFEVISCALVGYGFAKFQFKEKKFLFGLVLLTIVVPQQITIIPTFLNFRFFDFCGIGSLLKLITGKPHTINLIDTPWTFYLPAIFGNGIRSGLYIFIFRQFFRGMPKELEEAAKIDGCGAFQTFIRVIVPNAGSAFLTVILFSTVWYWNDYYLSVIYFNTHLPISVQLGAIQGGLASNQGSLDSLRTYLQAGSLITILPLLILYIIMQKYFTESVERTGIVG